MSKGGSTSSTVEVPEYIEDAARRNLTQADKISKLGFIPEYGPTVAAFTPMQEAAFQGTADLASAFGTPGGGMSMQDISGGMPAPTTYAGGVRGYSALPIYEQALEAFGQARPGQKQYIDSFFIDPFTGAAGSNMQAPIDYTVASTPGDLGGIGAGGGAGGGVGVGAGAGGVGGGGGGGDTFLGGDYLGGSEIAETSLINSDLTDEQFFDIFESGDGVPAVSVGSDGTTDSYVTDQDLYGAPGGFYGGSAANETALINSNLSDEDFWDTFEAGSPAGSGTGGLFTGGGADGVGNLGQVGDFFGGIGDALGITDYSGTGGGLLGGLNVTGPPVENKVTSYSHATDNDREFNAFYDTQIKDPVSGKTLTPFQLNNRINSPNLGKAYADAGITSVDQIFNPAPPDPTPSVETGIIYKDDRREVYLDGVLIGNPKGAEDAREMLAKAQKKKAEASQV